MNTKRDKYIGLAKVIVTCVIAMLLLPNIGLSESEEIYVFDRMAPTLEQPWFFQQPCGVATDDAGFVYISDWLNSRIHKLTPDGRVITLWGKQGSGPEELNQPCGIAVDSEGDVYVADSENHRIRKFDKNGKLFGNGGWGEKGDEDGAFNSPFGIVAVLHISQKIYVYVADTLNNRVQKFDKNGNFVTSFGSRGKGNGEFYWPRGIAMDSKGFLYVADSRNNRIQKFEDKGDVVEYAGQWGGSGDGDAQFNRPFGIAADSSDNIYVTDMNNHRVQKFTENGVFTGQFGDSGNEPGKFDSPDGIAIDLNGNIYVADAKNDRIQKFTGENVVVWGRGGGEINFHSPDGIALGNDGSVYVADTSHHRIQKLDQKLGFISKWGEEGADDGKFRFPYGLTVGKNGFVYVADTDNHRIQKFDENGVFKGKWGTEGINDGEFNSPRAIAADKDGNIYVADTYNHRIQKFDENGVFKGKWGIKGAGDGEFNLPRGIAVDKYGNVYVADRDNHRIQKFDREGNFLDKWGSEGDGESAFNMPVSVTVDDNGHVYVTDMMNHRIQKFDAEGEFITQWGKRGTYPKQMLFPVTGAVSPDGNTFFIADNNNHRVQKFKRIQYDSQSKAIIVAGGGFYEGNDLTDTIPACANDAYWTLSNWGFSDESIYYLSLDTDLDLNSDRESNVDIVASKDNLHEAITGWAGDANVLFIYLIGHGDIDQTNVGAFKIDNTNNFLLATDLASSLDAFPKETVVIYDACKAGSFTNPLVESPGEKRRIIITSASEDEDAHFINQGAVSFSNFFWRKIFDGHHIQYAFDRAKDEIKDYQTPHLEKSSEEILTENTYIRVGEAVDKSGSSGHKAVIVAGGSRPHELWPAVKDNITSACTALGVQGYGDNDIYLLSLEALLTESLPQAWKGTPTLLNLQDAIERWASENSQNDTDILIYLAGDVFHGGFQINDTEMLTMHDLDAWLDSLQERITGNVIVVYVAGSSANFFESLVPSADQMRVLITSTSDVQPSAPLSKTDISFSDEFWNNVSNGVNLLDAFWIAKSTVDFQHKPLLDDNGNGIGNEKEDGQLARYYVIGKGITEPEEEASEPRQETGSDIYEPDDDFTQAKPVSVSIGDEIPQISDDIIQYHNFYDPNDQDWVMFEASGEEDYHIKVSRLGRDCDVVIELYEADGTTLIERMDKIGDPHSDEHLDWTCPKPKLENTYYTYYVKISNIGEFGENTGYDLHIYRPIAPFSGFIVGTVTNASSGEPIEGASIRTDGNASAISFSDGGYVIVHAPADNISVRAEISGYITGTDRIDSLNDGETKPLDFELLKTCHSADYNPPDQKLTLSELLRVIQIYNDGAYHCDPGGEDGYALAEIPDHTCSPHDSDYHPQDWHISLSELLRLIQLYNADGYHVDPDGEDNFAPGK